VYDAPDDVNLNDVVEVVGVLSVGGGGDDAAKRSNVSPAKNSTFPHVHVVKGPILQNSISADNFPDDFHPQFLDKFSLKNEKNRILFQDCG
jgi:hypothetical protein